MASANLFQAYLQPPKSVSDYMAEMDSADIRREQLKGAQQTNALNALTMQDTLDQRRSAAEDRNALQRIAATWSANTSDDERIASLHNSGRAALMAKGDELRKQVLERKKTEAAAGKDSAETVGKYLDAMKTLAGGVLANPTPQAAMFAVEAWERLTGQKATEDRAQLAQMTTPDQIKAWAQSRSMTAEQYMTQMRQQTESDQRARNDLIGPDGKINMPVVQAKQQIARAGASQVNVNTDNLGLKPKDRFEMEGKLADDFKQVTKLDSGVLAATRKISTSLTKDGALKDQAAIYSFAKMLDPEGAVRESDYAAIANTSGLVDRVRNYANRLLTGEQLTPQQRNEMLELAKAFEGVANQRIKKAQGDFAGQAQRYNLRPEAVYGAQQQDEQPAGGKVVDFWSLK